MHYVVVKLSETIPPIHKYTQIIHKYQPNVSQIHKYHLNKALIHNPNWPKMAQNGPKQPNMPLKWSELFRQMVQIRQRIPTLPYVHSDRFWIPNVYGYLQITI